jgi:cytochrome c oxidase subunit 2
MFSNTITLLKSVFNSILESTSASSISYNDYAQPYQLGFQDSASPIMEGIVDLHHDIMFFMFVISVFVLYLLVRTVMLFHSSKNNFLKVTHGRVIEIV